MTTSAKIKNIKKTKTASVSTKTAKTKNVKTRSAKTRNTKIAKTKSAKTKSVKIRNVKTRNVKIRSASTVKRNVKLYANLATVHFETVSQLTKFSVGQRLCSSTRYSKKRPNYGRFVRKKVTVTF